MVEGIRIAEQIVRSPVDKNEMAKSLQPMRDLFTKSVVAKTEIKKGTVLSENHLTVKKPGSGIPAIELESLLGLTVTKDISKDTLIEKKDVE